MNIITTIATAVAMSTCFLASYSSAEIYYFTRNQLNQEYLSRHEISKLFEVEVYRDIKSILLSYKEYCAGIDYNDKKIYFVMKNGEKILYDDGIRKDYEKKLDNADIKNTLEFIYQPGAIHQLSAKNVDPGRFRNTKILNIVYGNTEKIVRSNCEKVEFCSRAIYFNKNNGASAALKRVWADIVTLLKDQPHLYNYICPTSGTLAIRNIEGTKRKSPHYYGIAIDLYSRNTDYWRWNINRKDAEQRILIYPLSIIDIFERNGFIWGGKWYHYDTMHFEYRPELIAKYRFVVHDVRK